MWRTGDLAEVDLGKFYCSMFYLFIFLVVVAYVLFNDHQST